MKEKELSSEMDKIDMMLDVEPELFEDPGDLFGSRHMELQLDSRFMGKIENPSGFGTVTGTCGKTLEFYLHICGERITNALFVTDGDQSARKCCSAVAQLSTGRSLDEAILIGGDTVLRLLCGLPKSRVHCAFLATAAFHAAIQDWMSKGERAGSS
jgi:nitrogen fixation protein NifU and related proteins